MTGASKMGFFSGFQPVDTVLSSPPTYQIVINDTDPIFFYCSAPGSCLTYGMVGVINPNASASVQKQQQLALSSAYMLNPGEPFPAETPSPSDPTSATPSSSSTGNTNEKKSRLTTRAIIAMSIGSACITVLAALLFFFWGRTKSLKDEVRRRTGTIRKADANSTRGMSMLESRAELGNTGIEDATNQPYQYPHLHQAPLPPLPPTDNGATYQQHQHQNQQYHPHPAYSPGPGYDNPTPTMPPYFPPSPLSTPPPHSHSPHAQHPQPHTTFPSSPHLQLPTPNKYDIPSSIGPHPAYSPLEYYQEQYQHHHPHHHHNHQYNTPTPPPTRHELSPTGDSQPPKLDHPSASAGTNHSTTTTPPPPPVPSRVTEARAHKEQERKRANEESSESSDNTITTTAGIKPNPRKPEEEGEEKKKEQDITQKLPGYFDSVYEE
jgi:hypothetical protein